MPAFLDTQHWPLLKLTLLGRDDDQSIEAMLHAWEPALRRGECAVLFDTTAFDYPSFEEAQRWAGLIADWLRSRRDLVQRNVACIAFVMTNPAVRFLLSSVLSRSPLPAAHTVCTTDDEALQWCTARLRDAGLLR